MSAARSRTRVAVIGGGPVGLTTSAPLVRPAGLVAWRSADLPDGAGAPLAAALERPSGALEAAPPG